MYWVAHFWHFCYSFSGFLLNIFFFLAWLLWEISNPIALFWNSSQAAVVEDCHLYLIQGVSLCPNLHCCLSIGHWVPPTGWVSVHIHQCPVRPFPVWQLPLCGRNPTPLHTWKLENTRKRRIACKEVWLWELPCYTSSAYKTTLTYTIWGAWNW